MIIRKKRIRSLGNNVRGIKRGDLVIVAIRGLQRFDKRLRQIGFSSSMKFGETILPGVIGPVSRFNAEGDYKVHKDQPMETAYRQSEWKWQEFRGRYDTEEMSKIVEVPYKRYPRTFIAPPSIELSISVIGDNEKALTAPNLSFTEENDQSIIHIINLFLEYFGECELLRENLTPITPAQMIRLNWEVLPKGRMPWAQLRRRLRPIIERQPEGNRAVIDKRHETISAYKPEFVAVGQGGFDGYVIFGFPSKPLYVLESTQINNATYVLDKDWEELSTMTKAELLNNDLHKDRLIHRESWFAQVDQILNA